MMLSNDKLTKWQIWQTETDRKTEGIIELFSTKIMNWIKGQNWINGQYLWNQQQNKVILND